jgi:predicted transposase/invertase (TIGR01784 family)
LKRDPKGKRYLINLSKKKMNKLIRFDWAVKRLLRNKANFGILEGFLSELLADEIKIDSILESESNQETGDNKANRVDLLVQNAKGELIIIEIQSTYMQDYLLRMLFASSKLIIDNMDKGMLYGKIKKIISVNIVYFNLGEGEDYIYRGTTSFMGLNKHDVLHLSQQEQKIYHTEQIEKIYPEYYIIKVNQFNEVAKNTLDEWIYFLKTEEVKDGFHAKGLKQAKETLDVLKLSPEERKEYDRYLYNWRDNESVTMSNFTAGEMKGGKQKQIEIAKKCLEKGMKIADISELTGLDETEIKELSQLTDK